MEQVFGLIGSSTDIISSENKQLNITEDKEKPNSSEEQLIIKEPLVMVKIIIHQHYKEVERNISCKQWVNHMTELFNHKTDGYVLEVLMKSKQELLLKMIIETK